MTERWALGGYSRHHSWAHCRYCGRAQDHDCARVECLLCGSPQCFGNGAGSGSCAVCHHGWLPGWSRAGRSRTCDYKGCEGEGVATARKRTVCAEHAKRVKVSGGLTLAEYVAKQLEVRDAGNGWQRWRLVG